MAGQGVTGADAVLRAALVPWTRRLALHSLAHWLIRGIGAGLLVVSGVLAIGWLVPWPMSDLQPIALRAAIPVFLLALIVGAWPRSMLQRAAELDTRLILADRLATAWLARHTSHPMAELQRADALEHLGAQRLPRLSLPRLELALVAAALLLALVLAFAPSPMRAVLAERTAEQAAVAQAAQRLDSLRETAVADASLTPEQSQRLDEVLQQARAELGQVHTQQEAQEVLARAAAQVAQVGDPAADAREQALAAMSEALSQDPRTRELGQALSGNDPTAAASAAQALADGADKLSDVERQGLARALQRAANVGRGDPQSSAALREAARSVGAGEPSQADFEQAARALQEALQTAAAQSTLRSTSQRLDDLRSALASGMPNQADDLSSGVTPNGASPMIGEPSRSLPIDPAPGQGAPGPAERMSGAGQGGADLNTGPADGRLGVAASENVFVPGAASGGPSDQDAVRQPFSVRGQPRPYREVIGQYAQAGRDYIDRASVAPSVRDLVKQYFSKLEEGQ